MEMIIDEDGQKCAEILVTKYGKYIFLCVYCNRKFQSFDIFQSHCLGHITLMSGLAIEEAYQNTENASASNMKSENIGRQFDGIENTEELKEEDGIKIEILWCDENKDNFSEKCEISVSCPHCKLSYKQHDQDLCSLFQNENLNFENVTEPQIQIFEGDDEYTSGKSSQQISDSLHFSRKKKETRKRRKLSNSSNSEEKYSFKNKTVDIFKEESKDNSDYSKELNKTRLRSKEKLNSNGKNINIKHENVNESISDLAESNNDFAFKGKNRIHCSHCNYDFRPSQKHDQNKCAKIQKVILSCNRDYSILSDQGIHLCKECPRYFVTSLKLAFHRRSHYNSGICHICNKKFVCLDRHLKFQHQDGNYEQKKVNPSYKCRYCDKTFAMQSYWKNHENVHENESLKCKTCGKIFKRKMYLINHIRTHTGERPYSCKLCPAAFAMKRNLDSHHIYKHTDEKNFACRHEGGCGKAFKTDYLRNQHERRHTGEKCFQCELCGASFTEKGRLIIHHKKNHMDYNDRQHHCQFCEKKFVERIHLVEHTRTHTGEKPMKCDKCSSSFAKSSALREHQKLHNPKKQHVCQLCGRSFAQASGYSNHMKNHP